MNPQKKGYNERKIDILRLAADPVAVRGITPMDVAFNFDIPYTLAKQLLYHYRNEELLNHPKRGLYKISKRGKDRLRYLETRLDICDRTGIDIGLNQHRDYKLTTPIYEIFRKYQEKGGVLPQGFTL